MSDNEIKQDDVLEEEAAEVAAEDDNAAPDEGAAETGAGAADAAEIEDGEDGDRSAAELQEENERLRDQMLRMAAELENFKKRMEREKQNALKFAEEEVLKALLPTLDNLERALAIVPESDDAVRLHEGVELTFKALKGAVEKFGLTAIDSVGQPFDPNIHEALTMEASAEVPAQHVLQEFEKGYYLKDKLLRAAKVVVSKGE